MLSAMGVIHQAINRQHPAHSIRILWRNAIVADKVSLCRGNSVIE